jgi:superfamily I DNA/RNA helicase
VTLFAVEGPAGCGKTCRLMEALGERLAESPLQDGQRVLALTFMHGARRRLNERLRGVSELAGRCECATIDSFAWRLLRRWRSLSGALGIELPREDQFDAQCGAAGALLERPEVRAWVAASFPIVLVDEAQDLKPERLRMIRGIAQSAMTLIAADEFQCLDGTLRPNPLIAWLREACQSEMLTIVHRTNVPALLMAAAAIRGGAPAVPGPGFQIMAAQGVPMAAAYLANAIAWRRGGNVAVITPSLRGGFARNVVQRVAQQACGAQRNGPYAIRWERSEDDEVATLVDGLNVADVSTAAETLAALERLPRSGPVREAGIWVGHQARVGAKTRFTRAEIEAVIARQLAMRRQRHGANNHDFAAMTVQQAKNREFEGVVVLWPYQVGGDAEHKRRLLYNAITRARRWCTIVVQNPNLLQDAPF